MTNSVKSVRKRIVRISIAGFWLFAFAFAVYVYFRNPIDNNVYGFFIHDERFWHCPACGLTRAVYCLMRFDFLNAFYYHACFVILLPIIAYTAVCLSINLWVGRTVIPYPKKYSLIMWICFGMWMAFSVLRNFTMIIY